MSKDLLNEVIMQMEESGFQIRVTACDSGNKHFLSELSFTEKSSSVTTNPAYSTRRIHFFPDALHLLKLMCDHLLDKGFLVPA